MDVSEISENDDECVQSSKIVDLQSLIHQLHTEKAELENDFGLKRAKFKEIYLQKEDELIREKEERQKTIIEINNLKSYIKSLQSELDECRSLAIVIKYQKENEVEMEQQRCQEEVASLQHILKEAVADAIQTTTSRYEKELKKLKKINEKLENDLIEQKSKDREGVLSVMTKSLRQKVGGLGSPIPFTSGTSETVENLEESMKKAQEDAEMLRSLVIPLEEEIKALKDKLRSTDNQLQISESNFAQLVKVIGTDVIYSKLQENANENLSHLQEKIDAGHPEPSFADLQLFVLFLHTQNSLLQTSSTQLKQEMQQVQAKLLKEQKDHISLKKTWQIVNDQFLETQRIHKREIRRLQNVMTPNQLRQISHQTSSKNSQESESYKIINKHVPATSHRRYCSADNKSIGALKEFGTPGNRCLSAPENLSQPTKLPVSPVKPISNFNGLRRACSLDALEINSSKDKLLSVDFTPPKICFSLDNQSSSTPTVIQSNFKLPYEKSCDMCSVYKHQIEQLKLELYSQKSQCLNMEKETKLSAQEYQVQVEELRTKHAELLNALSEQKSLYDVISSEVYSQVKELTKDREIARNEIHHLQQENEYLLGKHLARSHQYQNEIIDLPDTLEDMQFLCLKLREDLITALVSKEKIEGSLRTENLVLEERLISEQNKKATLSSELNSMREQAAEKPPDFPPRRLKLDEKLHGKLFSSYNTGEVSALQNRIDTLWQIKTRLEEENQQLKTKVTGLQTDLDINEGVQRDFVKLSQTLQIELEKIRQQGTEVRWQHEDDVMLCNTCKECFTTSNKLKEHCRHCGQIFCPDCLDKSVVSGPNRRTFNVCNVCHTLLDHTTAPYFSHQPISSPH